MTNEELVEKIQQGERDLIPELWEQVRRFVAKVAKKWAGGAKPGRGYHEVNDFAEELIQEGYIAFVEAVESFDASKGTVFLTHLDWYLKSHFLQACADASGISRGVYERALVAKRQGQLGQITAILSPTSLNMPVGDGPEKEKVELGDFLFDPADHIADLEEQIYQRELHDKLEEALSKLSTEEQKAIRSRYYDEKTFLEVATMLGVSQYQAKRTEERALQKLRAPKVSLELESFIERNTNYFLHVGVQAFQSSGSSAVERIVEMRERLRAEKGGTPWQN